MKKIIISLFLSLFILCSATNSMAFSFADFLAWLEEISQANDPGIANEQQPSPGPYIEDTTPPVPDPISFSGNVEPIIKW